MTPIENITFAEALEDYICSKDRLLSPSTVRGYRTMQRSSFDRINDLQISELTEKVIQRWVNSLADKYSSKTIRNQVGLLTERISPHSPNYIWKHFDRICEENGIPHFTIHSLRHANASAMLKLNIPDKYAMERMGHSTPNMLKQVYQHIFRDEQTKVANKMNDYFNDILN